MHACSRFLSILPGHADHHRGAVEPHPIRERRPNQLLPRGTHTYIHILEQTNIYITILYEDLYRAHFITPNTYIHTHTDNASVGDRRPRAAAHRLLLPAAAAGHPNPAC